MFSEMTLPYEVAATRELIDGLRDAIKWNIQQYHIAETEEDKRVYEAKLKDLAKTLNEVRSCKDHQTICDEQKIEIEKLQLELEKLEASKTEAKKSRIFDGIKTGFIAGISIFTTWLGIKASRDNMKVLQEYETEHYIATTAEKEAVKSSCDVLGTMRKFENRFVK